MSLKLISIDFKEDSMMANFSNDICAWFVEYQDSLTFKINSLNEINSLNKLLLPIIKLSIMYGHF